MVRWWGGRGRHRGCLNLSQSLENILTASSTSQTNFQIKVNSVNDLPKSVFWGRLLHQWKGSFSRTGIFFHLDLQFWCQRKVTQVKRVLGPSPNHQIPLKGLRPPRPGVLPFSSTFLDKITSLIIFALTDLAFAKGGLCPSQLCLGCGWQSSIQLSIPVRGGHQIWANLLPVRPALIRPMVSCCCSTLLLTLFTLRHSMLHTEWECRLNEPPCTK